MVAKLEQEKVKACCKVVRSECNETKQIGLIEHFVRDGGIFAYR